MYCVSTDGGKTWLKLNQQSLNAAKKAAHRMCPLVIYGQLILGIKEMNKPVKRIAITSTSSRERARWIEYVV